MPHPLSSKLDLIAPSPTLVLDSKVKAMQASGLDIINFGIGEPDFQTPEYIKEAAIKAIKDGFTLYTATDGILELKEAIINKLKNDNGLIYKPSQIVVSNGGKHSLYNTFQCLFQKGDEVIVPAPYWVSYVAQITLSGAKPVIVETKAEDNYLLTPKVLEKAITANTKGLIINSPSNPTGSAYNLQALKDLAALILKNNLWVISDDIYEKIIFDKQKFYNMPMAVPELYNSTIIINGLSKSHAMTGWRMGYLAAPENVAKAATKLQSQCTSNISSITQKAAVTALTKRTEELDNMLTAFQRRRDLVVKLLNQIEGVICPKPQGAFYAFPDMSFYYGKSFAGKQINNSIDLADFLLENANASLVPGISFGADQALRLSYAVKDEDCEKGILNIEKALKMLK